VQYNSNIGWDSVFVFSLLNLFQFWPGFVSLDRTILPPHLPQSREGGGGVVFPVRFRCIKAHEEQWPVAAQKFSSCKASWKMPCSNLKYCFCRYMLLLGSRFLISPSPCRCKRSGSQHSERRYIATVCPHVQRRRGYKEMARLGGALGLPSCAAGANRLRTFKCSGYLTNGDARHLQTQQGKKISLVNIGFKSS